MEQEITRVHQIQAEKLFHEIETQGVIRAQYQTKVAEHMRSAAGLSVLVITR